METERQTGKSWMPDSALIIAVITVTAYFWALWYELGVCSYFRISPYFVSLNSTSVLFTSTPFIIGIIALLIVFLIMMQILSFARKSPRNMFFVMMPVTTVMLLILLFCLYYDKENRLFLIVIIALLITLVLILFLAPLFQERNTGRTYWDKLINGLGSRSKTAVSTSLPALNLINFTTIATACVIGFITVVGITYIFYKAGNDSARTSEIFYVIEKSDEIPEVVVLRIYGDYLLTAPFNNLTNEIEKSLYILKMSEMSKIALISKKVGKLHVKP